LFSNVPQFIEYLTLIYRFLAHGNDEGGVDYVVNYGSDDEFDNDVEAEDD